MAKFLRENWIWIVAPIVVVVVAVVILLVTTESDPAADFTYNLRW
jgi:hypothetical protein